MMVTGVLPDFGATIATRRSGAASRSEDRGPCGSLHTRAGRAHIALRALYLAMARPLRCHALCASAVLTSCVACMPYTMSAGRHGAGSRPARPGSRGPARRATPRSVAPGPLASTASWFASRSETGRDQTRAGKVG